MEPPRSDGPGPAHAADATHASHASPASRADGASHGLPALAELPPDTRPLERYALLGDQHTAALVSDTGSVDWLCAPRFDSPACFAALLGTPEHGRWQLAPADPDAVVEQRGYRERTLTLETVWRTATGRVRVLELMPVHDRRADLVRRVEGLDGSVRMRQELVVRFGYGQTVPWLRRVCDDGSTARTGFALRATRVGSPDADPTSDPAGGEPAGNPAGGDGLLAVAGPDALMLRCDPLPIGDGRRHVGVFEVRPGQTRDLVLTWFPSHRPPPPPRDADEISAVIERDESYWRDWARACVHDGAHHDAVVRSLIVLRALTHQDTGGIVAAPTTSLPEWLGGSRNWDYRYCWLRDAALTLEALLAHGYVEVAEQWRQWLLRAVAGIPQDVQIMYGVGGERRLEEYELDHLPGYEASTPVRVGNGAVDQLQVDVIGEVLVALYQARVAGADADADGWALVVSLLDHLATVWDEPDHGIWEIRSELRHFTHSRIMAWAAFDRGVRLVEEFGRPGDPARWRQLAGVVRERVLAECVDRDRGCLVQYPGTRELDAALLQAAQVGFLAWDDPLMLGTVAAIEEDLMPDGLVLRYRTTSGVDGLDGDEHPFLACSFWLVEHWARTGRQAEADALMDRLTALADPGLGLLSEEFDPVAHRMTGNMPQAFSHLALIRAAEALDHVATPSRDMPS